MSKIKPLVFTITENEVRNIAREILPTNKFSNEQVKKVLEYVECDEFLAKEIRISIVTSITEVIR